MSVLEGIVTVMLEQGVRFELYFGHLKDSLVKYDKSGHREVQMAHSVGNGSDLSG